MRGVIRWFRTPLPLKFWLFAASALLVLVLAIREVVEVADWWGVAIRSCGVGCVSTPGPFSRGWPAVAYMVLLCGVGTLLVWHAIRAYQRRS